MKFVSRRLRKAKVVIPVLAAIVIAMTASFSIAQQAKTQDDVQNNTQSKIQDVAHFATISYKDSDDNQHLLSYTNASTFESAFNSLTYDNVVIDLYSDWNISDCIYIPKNKTYTINLHGNVINRGLASSSWYGDTAGQVITVRTGSNLTINGGTEKTQHKGTLYDQDCFWKLDTNGSTVITGGLITGGATDSVPGAGIAVWGDDAKLNLNNVTSAGNVSDSGYNSESGCGGGIGYSYMDYEGSADSAIKLSNTRVIYNHAESDGGGIYNNGTFRCTVDIDSSSEISNNYADEDGGGIYFHSGGASDDVGAKLTVTSSAISNNRISTSSSHYGAGIYFSCPGSVCELNGATISGNKSTSNGAGIYLTDGKLNVLKESKITSNTSGGNGGGIYFDCDDSSFTIDGGSRISSNKAVDGAGVYIESEDTTCTISGTSDIYSNTASGDGGGIYVDDDNATIKLADKASIQSNKAVNGAGIYNKYENCKVQFSGTASISSNTASSCGGGIYSNDQLIVESENAKTNVIAGNNAVSGAGIWFSEEATLNNVCISYNMASSKGGGVYCDNSSYSTFIMKNTMTIDKNYLGDTQSVRSNLVMKGSDQHIDANTSDSSSYPTAESRIGVTIEGYSGGSARQITGTSAFINKFENSVPEVIYSDNDSYGVTRSPNGSSTTFAWLCATPATYNININYNGSTITKTCQQGKSFQLVSSDYAKSGEVDSKATEYKITSWSMRSADGLKTLKNFTDGKTSFTMPACSVTLTPTYLSSLAAVSVTIKDKTSEWDSLTSKDKAYVFDATLTDASGSDVSASSEEIEEGLVELTEASATDLSAKQKKLTYTVKIKRAFIEDNDMYDISEAGNSVVANDIENDGNTIKSAKFKLKTPFDEYLNQGSYKVSIDKKDAADGIASVCITATYVVNDWRQCVVKFDSNGGNETFEDKTIAYGDTVSEPDDPTRDGFTFKSWQLDGKDFDFATAITSDITLVASWEEDSKPDGGDEGGDDKGDGGDDQGGGDGDQGGDDQGGDDSKPDGGDDGDEDDSGKDSADKGSKENTDSADDEDSSAVAETKNTKKISGTPKTGDDFTFTFAGLVLVGGAAAIAAIVIKRREHKLKE